MGRMQNEAAERILIAFREAPGLAQTAAKVAGVDKRTARKAWEKGLASTNNPKYHEPFSQIIEREQVEARARLQTEETIATTKAGEIEAARRAQLQEHAQKDITEGRVQEASMVRMARSGAIVLLNTLAQVTAGASVVGKKVRKTLEDVGNDPNRDLTLKEANEVTKTLNRLTTSLRQASDAAQKAMEMERLLLGEPTNITGHLHVSLEPVPIDQARERVVQVERTLRTLEEEGIKVVDGNAAATDPNLQ